MRCSHLDGPRMWDDIIKMDYSDFVYINSVPLVVRLIRCNRNFILCTPALRIVTSVTHFTRLISRPTIVMFTAPYYSRTYLVAISGGHKDKLTPRIAAALSGLTELSMKGAKNGHVLALVQSYSHRHSSAMGYGVEQLVKALRYKPEGRGFDSRWGHWPVPSGRTMALGSTQPVHRNEYQGGVSLGVKTVGA